MGSGRGKTRRAQATAAATPGVAEQPVKEKVVKSSRGLTVEFVDAATGKASAFKIVAHHEQDVTQGLLSIESPVGKALDGQDAGAKVAVHLPSGKTRNLQITKVTSA